jgi:hypothetical protein
MVRTRPRSIAKATRRRACRLSSRRTAMTLDVRTDRVGNGIEAVDGRRAVNRLCQTAHRSIDSCQHDHSVECSHQKPQLHNPHACRLYNSSVEGAAVKTSKGARRWERSSGSIAEPAGICGPTQQKRRKSLSRVPVQSTWSAPMHPLSILDLYGSIRGEDDASNRCHAASARALQAQPLAAVTVILPLLLRSKEASTTDRRIDC